LSRVALTAAEARRLRPLAAAVGRARRARSASLELVAGDLGPPGTTVGLLAGSFNPLTRAHTVLAVVGHQSGCERVVLVMAPASLGKEGVERAHAVDRLAWTVAWARRKPWAAVAVAGGGLLVDMAEALGAAGVDVVLLLGADKAAQLVEPHWYDDHAAAMARLGAAASALVAARAGYPSEAAAAEALPMAAVGLLPTPVWVPKRSATEARAAAAAGAGPEELAELLPAAVARTVVRLRAYDPDPGPYLARAAALDVLERT
jgi:nicotinic acid mononucleotide adenylyltransferase